MERMNTRVCTNCTFWDQSNVLQMSSLGSIAPCTRHSPNRYSLQKVDLTQAMHDSLPFGDADVGLHMRLPMAVWPYTSASNYCGDFYPCDLDECVRRSQNRAAPLV
jgi:hypothetical protein